MRYSRHLLMLGVVGLWVLLAAGPVRTQEGQATPLLRSSDPQHLLSIEGILTNPDPLSSARESFYFQELSPLELALLPKGAWIDPRSKLSWPGLEEPADPREDWGPLSEQAFEGWKKELASKALEYGAELADSLRASYLSQGIEWTRDTLSSYRNALSDRYRLHLKLSGRQAGLQYDYKY